MSPATQILRANGRTVAEVAWFAGMTPGAVSHVLCGRTTDASPVLDAIERMAGAAVARDVERHIETARAIRVESERRRVLRGES